MKEHILRTDSSALKSILTPLGPGRLKRLEAAQLYLHEKTRSGELRVETVLGTLNPAGAMTNFIDNKTLEIHFEKLGLVISECMPDAIVGIRKDVHAERQVAGVVRLHLEQCEAAGS